MDGERARRGIGALARWLFVLCLPVLLITASLAGAFNSFWLYQHGLQKYGISEKTGLAPAELDKAARGLISYFNSGEENISITVVKDGRPFPLFNQREIVHLRDVKGLVQLDYRLLLGTGLYAAGYALFCLLRKQRRNLAGAAFAGGLLTLGLMVVLGIGMALDFSSLFWQFHLISFSNDFWLLDPSRDYLVMMFPEPFWNDAARDVAIAAAGMAIVIGGAGAAYLKVRTS